MPYRSHYPKTQTAEVPSQSSSTLGGVLGGLAGLAVGVATANPALGFGIGSSVGGALGAMDTDTQTYELPQEYGSVAQQIAPAVSPLPDETPEQFHARISKIFRANAASESEAFYG